MGAGGAGPPAPSSHQQCGTGGQVHTGGQSCWPPGQASLFCYRRFLNSVPSLTVGSSWGLPSWQPPLTLAVRLLIFPGGTHRGVTVPCPQGDTSQDSQTGWDARLKRVCPYAVLQPPSRAGIMADANIRACV